MKEKALNLYKNGEITSRQAAVMCNLTLREFLNLSSRRGIYLDYGVDELAEDLTSNRLII